MKKTYINPTMKVVEIKPAQILEDSIDMYGKNAQGEAMGRKARFSDWEEVGE